MAGASYSMVEAVLAKIFGADAAAQKGALRGRIKHLQRLGLTVKARRGVRRIAYTNGQIYELGFCLQLEQLGVDPTLAVKLLQAQREYILGAYAHAELAEREDWFFWLSGLNFMSAAWSKEKRKFPGLPEMGAGPIRRLEGTIAHLWSGQGTCLAVFQMTPLVREVLEAAKAQND